VYQAAQQIIVGKPAFLKDNKYIDKLYQEIGQNGTTGRKTIRIVHVSDFHADPWYQEGTIADCGQGYCCRNDSTGGSGKIKAGKFGTPDVNCDIPLVTVNNTLNFIRDHVKPDVVFWTGDSSPHDHQLGAQAIYEAAHCLKVTAQMLSEALSD
jgi:hypothetical protein